MANFSIPILPVSTVSGNQWNATRIIEEASQTFKAGTVVVLAAGDGGVQAATGAGGTGVATGVVVGISYEAASNLASTGLGAPVPYSPITGLGATLTFGSVPNQTSAKNIPHGAPFNDGRIGLILPTADTVFSAALGATGAAATPAATNVGKTYGLSLDTNGYWYVDTAATNKTVTVSMLDPRDVPAPGTRVLFSFISSAVVLLAV